jgi:hypothetical protein
MKQINTIERVICRYGRYYATLPEETWKMFADGEQVQVIVKKLPTARQRQICRDVLMAILGLLTALLVAILW